MEGTVTRAPAARRKSSTRGSRKTQAARTRAPSLSSQAAPDVTDAAPGKGSYSSGSESLPEKQLPVLRANQPSVLPEKEPPVLRAKQPPVLQEKKPPVLQEKKPPVLRAKQPPVLQEKKPPVLQEKKPPVLRAKQPPVLPEKEPPVLRAKQPPVLPEKEPPVLRAKQPPVLQEKKPPVFQEKQPPVLQEKKPPVLRAKQPPVLPEKEPSVLQEKLPTRVPGSQATKKGLPHPRDVHTLQEGRPVLKKNPGPGVLTPLSNEPGILPKGMKDPEDRKKGVPRQNSVGRRLQQVVEKLKLRRQETSQACVLVNQVVDHLQRRLPLWDPAFRGIERLGTGSYYEQVKISAPNEFDIMLKLEVSRIELEEYDDSGAFYFVKFKRNPAGNPLISFLDNGILSASKLLSQFRKIIKAEVNHIKEMDIIVERKKPSSPAVTLLIRKPEEISVDIVLALESRSSWPPSTQGGLTIENWLGRKVKTEFKFRPVYLISKPAKERNGFEVNTWRLSFSHIEKDILKNHGSSKTCCEEDGVPCCRKKCLKLMKYLLEQLKKKFENRKELDKFNSYHMKTAFFHLCAQKPDDSQWQLRDLEQCFDDCVSYFLQCLQVEQLVHFFIPRCNLFSRDLIGKTSQVFLLRQIEFQRNNMFPVFHE
ncbi:cyclic GMP-AMP synthase [Notamacropus eugenii]|uniref:cyclic GMP-AMP synthase n=1 Tax=Notamacropus eugenii TaxID=9315 RepID=UPI003B67EE76